MEAYRSIFGFLYCPWWGYVYFVTSYWYLWCSFV